MSEKRNKEIINDYSDSNDAEQFLVDIDSNASQNSSDISRVKLKGLDFSNPEHVERLKDFKDNIALLVKGIKKSYSLALNNFVNPYTDIFSNINEYINSFVESLKPLVKSSKAFKAVEKLADAQYVRWEFYSEDYIELVIGAKSINKTLRLFHEREKYKSVLDLCDKTIANPMFCFDLSRKRLYKQSVQAFKEGGYNLAVLGLTAVIEGILTEMSGDQSTKLSKKLEPIIDRIDEIEENSFEFSMLSLMITLERTFKTFTAFSDFSRKEPNYINRNWIMHGRSTRRRTKLDCVKLIRFIYGLLLIDQVLTADEKH